ncbi:MAG: hypothetical protein ACE5EL_00270 [Anaerolineae bacterium]
MALLDGSLPHSLPTFLAPAAAVAAIATAASRISHGRWPPWSARGVIVIAVAGAGGGLLSGLLFVARPYVAFLESTGLPALLDGVNFLPALLAGAILRRPGSMLVAMALSQLVALAAVSSVAPALSLLDVPLAVAAAEGWLMWRGPGRPATTALVGAGLLLGIGSTVAALTVHPGAHTESSLLSMSIMRASSGALAGYFASRLVVLMPALCL